jgi:anaphase-promoting complex subunit 5
MDSNLNLEQLSNIATHIESIFPTMIKVHYLRYLICIRKRDWEGAIDSLHRYFDYCYCDSLPFQQAQPGTNTNGMIASYASLNLAALHYQFGHYGAAIQSIQETIRIAHQKNEHDCLALALAWLFRLADCKGMTKRTELLIKKCIEKSEELGMHDLLSQSLLVYAKLFMLKLPYSSSNRLEPAHVWKEIDRSMKVNIENNLNNLSNTNLLVRSSIWEYFGNKKLSVLFANLVADEMKNVIQEDFLMSHCRLALMDAEEGKITNALERLIKIQGHAQQTTNVLYIQAICTILFNYFYRMNQIHNSRIVLEKLNDLHGNFTADSMDKVEYESDIFYKRGQLLSAEGKYQEAVQLVQSSLEKYEKTNFHISYAKQLLLLVEIFMMIPECQTSAIKHVVTGLNLCKERNLQNLLACFTLYFVHIILSMDAVNLPLAKQKLEDISNQIIQNSSAADRGYLYLLHGKLLLLEAKKDNENKLQLVSQALKFLGRAKEEFKQIYYLTRLEQALFMEAQAYNMIEKINQRDASSKQFVQLVSIRKSQPSADLFNLDLLYNDVGTCLRSFIEHQVSNNNLFDSLFAE